MIEMTPDEIICTLLVLVLMPILGALALHFTDRYDRRKRERLEKQKFSAIIDPKIKKKTRGTIDWFKGATIQRVVRRIPPDYDYNYHNTDDKILADILYVQTDKGTMKITSCLNCDLLYVKRETGVTLFEDLDFNVVKETS